MFSLLFGTYLILTRTRGVKLLKLLFIYVFLDYLFVSDTLKLQA